MFRIITKSKKSKARLGELAMNHGVLKTPFFMPDATRAGIKNVSVGDLSALNLEAMVVNTFHLYLQPGMSLIKKFKGVHNFMSWQKPLLSDSGGYQVFSLIYKNTRSVIPAQAGIPVFADIHEIPAGVYPVLRYGAKMTSGVGKITDTHVEFRSPIDGSRHILTPEKSIQIQFDLDVDMMVVLDDCPPNDFDKKQIINSVERTIAWAKRCRQEFDKQIKKRKLQKNKPLLFGVVQGGMNVELRKQCVAELVKIGFDGLGFGARHIDSEGFFLTKVLEETAKNIPNNYLRFALGIGAPEDIVKSVKLGWDMFDCVIPTREGRHGRLYKFKNQSASWRTKIKNNVNNNFYKIININNSEFAKKTEPINKFSKVTELRNYSLGYLHHLFKISDPLGQKLGSLNNLEFYLDLMKSLQYGIENGKI